MPVDLILNLINALENLGLEPKPFPSGEFYDEPRFHIINTDLRLRRKFTDGRLVVKSVHGSGVSFFDASEALTKSIYEAMERFCEFSYKKAAITYKYYDENSDKFMNLRPLLKNPKIKNQVGWIKGLNLMNKKSCLIPAQLAFLNYKRLKKELFFDYPSISTGSAAGSSPEHAILNGLYEVIERDGFMSIYLNSISPSIIDLESIEDRQINWIVNEFKAYNLDLYVLDTTTDIGIPSVLALIIDKQGFPSISLGAKAGLQVKNIIKGAITESLMTRIFIKNMLKEGRIASDLSKGEDVFSDRARQWILPEALHKIRFLFNGKRIEYKTRMFVGNYKEELSEVLRRIETAGFSAYTCDITFPEFRKLNFYVYQTLIPGLQPLYLHEGEKNKSLNEERLKRVAAFFNAEYKKPNSVPHPFL